MRLLDLLIKGAGHKYIKRIPVGTTKTGKVRYRYIYRADHTVGGKHILDEAHLKPGTKLMLHSKDGAEVHAHIDSVDGDQVTFTYDDGDRKGETRTVSKQKLLGEFDQEHKIGEKIDAARDAAISDYARMVYHKTASEKQRKRVYDRIQRLTREIPEVSKPEVETLSSGTGKLAKSLLEKHKVDAEQVQAALESFSVKPTRLDMWYRTRLLRVQVAGIERAVETYNRSLEQAAQDNAGVLAAVEAYRELINPYNNPEMLNQLVDRTAEFYSMLTDHVLKDKRVLENSGASDYGELTQADIKAHLPPSEADKVIRIIKRHTGLNIEETGQTLAEAYGQLNPEDILLSKLKQEAAQTAEAQILLAEVQKQVAESCSDFMLAGIKGTGLHTNHSIDVLNKTDERIVLTHADELNKIEQVFLAAYPERADTVNVSLRREKGSRAGAVLMESMKKQILKLPRTHSLSTAAHELTHTLEGGAAYPYQVAIQEAVTLTHLTRITKGDIAQYTKKEQAYNDEYHDVYAGKLYDDGSSELVTMGVQEMFKSKEPEAQARHIASFAAKDPHHFLVTYAILKGYTKHES